MLVLGWVENNKKKEHMTRSPQNEEKWFTRNKKLVKKGMIRIVTLRRKERHKASFKAKIRSHEGPLYRFYVDKLVQNENNFL